jgi:peptidoglycan/LPS O-acetylase OafA/YrhL
MLWQFRRDFVSLFTRGNDKENYLNPIDGLRSIASLLIILLHLVAILTSFVSPYPDVQWQQYLTSKAFAFSTIMGFALDIFFMISAFLLTHKLITQWNQKCSDVDKFLQKEYPISIIKRAFRLWPGILLATIILFIFGEPFYPHSGYLFEFFRHFNIWMFFQNYVDLEYWHFTLVPLWSISADMQAHIILPLILYLFYSWKKFISIYNCLFILLLISIIRGIIVFDPTTMPVLTLAYRYPPLPLLSPDYVTGWFERNYNLTFSSDFPKVNPAKLFMHKMYLPLEARFGSFIIGAMLAIRLIESSNHENKPKTFKKFLFFGLICFQMLSLIQGPDVFLPPDFVMKLGIATSRQLFTICQAFVLFTALSPSTHPYHSPWLKKFLSSSIWIPISKLSYFVYLIHLRISAELIFGGPLSILKTYSVTYAALIALPIVLFITQLISSIWYILAEKPIERIIQHYFQKHQSSKLI